MLRLTQLFNITGHPAVSRCRVARARLAAGRAAARRATSRDGRADAHRPRRRALSRRGLESSQLRRDVRLHVEPDSAHQLEGVAVLDDAGAHPVVEHHLALSRSGPRSGRSAPDRRASSAARSAPGRGSSPDRSPPPVTSVRTMASAPMRRSCELVPCEDLVEQEQQRQRTARRVDDRPDARGSRRRSARCPPAASPRPAAWRRWRAATASARRHAPARRPAPGRHCSRRRAAACSSPTCSSR